MRMKYLLTVSTFFFSHLLLAQVPSGWDGSFEGNILGVQATLSGKQSGALWTATLDVSGYLIDIEGSITSEQCSGTMTDPQTKETSPFTAQVSGNQINIHLHDINPLTGQVEDMRFAFTRSTTTPAETPSRSSAIVAGADPAKLDRALFGLWRYTDTYVSGEYSFATDYFIQFNPDGVVLITNGRAAGGGPTSSIVSGEADTHEGIWKSENKTLWVRDAENPWQIYARYAVDGNSMMLTYNNGNKQVWERL